MADPNDTDKGRRDFIFIATGAVAAVGAAATVWPFIDQMEPAADTRAMSTTEVDLSSVTAGQQIKVIWQGKPVFVRHRTPDEISAAQRDPADGAQVIQFGAARSALERRLAAQVGSAPARNLDAEVEDAIRLGFDLDHGLLPIQGPPGAGKTFTGAHMVLALAFTMQGCGKVESPRETATLGSPPRLDQPAPEIEGVDQDGNKLRLSDYRGKVVLLDFWSQV